jgi:hypothetical protein
MDRIYIPSMTEAIGAYEAGQDRRQQRDAVEGRRQVGGLMAAGDYAGAARSALQSGDLDLGMKAQQVGAARQEAERRARLGTMAATDPGAAAREALAGGDLDFYKELDGIADAQKLQKAQAFGGVLRGIAAEPEDMWDDLISGNRAQLEALDIPPNEIDFFIQSSPEQRRVLMATMLQRADMLDGYLTDRFEQTKFQAQERDRAADNARADQQLQISRGSLGVSQANLAQRRAEHAARVAGRGGYGAPGGASYSDLPAGAVVVQ